jgi:hypothetical protein
LGFEEMGGDISQNWVILKNGDHVIGLFQGLFEGNMLTFNPGWDQNTNQLDPFTDVRDIHKELISQGINLITKVEEPNQGPAHIMLADPDGNMILIDQHR